MKRIFFITTILLSAAILYAQEEKEEDIVFYKHEVKISYGMETFPNVIRMDEKGLWKGGFTANYMYHIVKRFWVGVNINWQFPSDLEYYEWREYYIDGAFKDFQISKRDNFFAIAPEFRFSYANLKWATLYSALSAGYGIHTGLDKKNPSNDFLHDYWYWNVTFFGGNFHIGKKQNFFVGGEAGVGFKGTLNIHAGYRF